LPLSDAVHYADVQYAPIEDGSGHSGRPRYYKNSLKVLAAACEAWNSNKVQFGKPNARLMTLLLHQIAQRYSAGIAA
jgi:hypothetical protein